MAVSTEIRMGLNRLLAMLGLRIDTLTAERREHGRLDALAAAGLFDRPVYALSPGMADFDLGPIARAFVEHKDELQRLRDANANDVGYDPDNNYFRSPDMDALYLIIRMIKPRRIVEVGCGSSTRISRQAIIDGQLDAQIIAIDPWPRNDIANLVDHFVPRRLEEVEDYSMFESLERDDVLFIDSSHMAHLGNDVARLFCDIIPRLAPGVVVHVHDIFLPYEYPRAHGRAYAGWGEQYVLHTLLQGGHHTILWPGHYLQRTGRGLGEAPFLANDVAQSFWFRIGG